MLCFGIGAYSTYQKITFIHRIAQYKRLPSMDDDGPVIIITHLYA